MFVYVALGAPAPPAAKPPGVIPGRKLFSKTSLERLRDACARFGAEELRSFVDPLAGVLAPLVKRPSSLLVLLLFVLGVAIPETLSRGVAAAELALASRREDSPRMALMFLFRRWLGFQLGLRKDL